LFKATHAAKRRGWLRPLPKQIAGMPEAQAPFKIQEPIHIKLQFATNNKLDTSPDISSDNGVTQPQTEDVDTYHTRCHRQHRQPQHCHMSHRPITQNVTRTDGIANQTKNTDWVLGPLNPTSSPRNQHRNSNTWCGGPQAPTPPRGATAAPRGWTLVAIPCQSV
jgi:hypothetical protein